jgi:CBS domain-containing protein
MSTTAAEIMTSPAVTARPEQPIAEVAQLLASRRISAVPVCAPDGTLLGMISELEIIRPFRESARARGDWWLSRLAEGEVLSQEFLDHMRRDNRSAADVMIRHVITAEAGTSLPELAELMTAHGVKRLPVLRQGKVVGVVSRADLVKAIARAPGILV